MHRALALLVLLAACATPTPQSPTAPIGRWTVMTAVVSIRPDGSGWIVRHEFPSGEVVDRVATQVGDDFHIDDSQHGDFYRLLPDGSLEARDCEGLVQVAAPMR